MRQRPQGSVIFSESMRIQPCLKVRISCPTAHSKQQEDHHQNLLCHFHLLSHYGYRFKFRIFLKLALSFSSSTHSITIFCALLFVRKWFLSQCWLCLWSRPYCPPIHLLILDVSFLITETGMFFFVYPHLCLINTRYRAKNPHSSKKDFHQILFESLTFCVTHYRPPNHCYQWLLKLVTRLH